MDIDIFAPVSCPEPYSLDLVTIASRFSTHGLARSASADTIKIPTGLPSSHQTGGHLKSNVTSNITSSKGADTRLNCSLCKKSFGTEATWASHQKSAKHQAAVKEAEKKEKNASKKVGGQGQNKGGVRPATPAAATAKATSSVLPEVQSPQPDSPELAGALQSLQKAEAAAKTHPSLVAPVLWKAVKVLWTHKLYKDTKDGLLLLISILENLQKNNSSGTTPQQGNLTPTQINLTLYLARLAAARLVVYETPHAACEYYVDAIQGRWQMPASTFQMCSERIALTPADQLMTHVHDFLEKHDKTQKLVRHPEPAPATTTESTSAPAVPKKQPDPNLKLLTVLTEMGSLLAQSSSSTASSTPPPPQRRGGNNSNNTLTSGERSQAEFALVALTMALAIARFDPDQAIGSGATLAPTLMRRRAMIYKRLGMPHYASQCYSETAPMPGCAPSDRAWDEFQAMLLALEADDPIRVQHSLKRAAASSLLDTYLDAQVLIMMANAIESADDDVLENDVCTHVDHLRLLVQTGVTDQLLMAKHCPQFEFMGIVDRIHSLLLS
ncbi:hypothetical protein DFQ26_008116 [Actinomortierella ambigua]|nr:hypothetical protein DFQ26_008116 [Actinomortierella ambigua]